MRFEITPFVNAGPLSWGMRNDEVAAAIGAPDSHRRVRSGTYFEYWDKLSLTCSYDESSRELVEVGFSKLPDLVTYQAKDLIAEDHLIILRVLSDGGRNAAWQGLGSIVFPSLGISLTGYFPEDPEIQAVTAFARGRWDRVLSSMKSLSIEGVG